jgi:hypothetical protein
MAAMAEEFRRRFRGRPCYADILTLINWASPDEFAMIDDPKAALRQRIESVPARQAKAHHRLWSHNFERLRKQSKTLQIPD